MKDLLESVTKRESGYIVCSANSAADRQGITQEPLLAFQDRPDMVRPLNKYVAEMGDAAVPQAEGGPAGAHAGGRGPSGRRNNPPGARQGDPQPRGLSPLHYQELPELFMDFICSLTGKSPSTTAAGSEGAADEGPVQRPPGARRTSTRKRS